MDYMRTRVGQLAVLGFTAAILGQALQAQITGPVSGFVFDRSARGLRPILGIPGASVLGAPLNLGFAVASAFVAPQQDSAAIVTADGAVHLFSLQSGTPVEETPAGITPALEHAVFSPSGTAVALYGAGAAQIITGLPGAPAITGSVDLSQAGTVGSLAVSDDGAALLIAAGGFISFAGSSGTLHNLIPAGNGAQIAFAPGGYEAVVADPASSAVEQFSDVTSGSQPTLVAGPGANLAPAVGLAFSTDGGSILLANASGVTAFNLAAGGSTTTSCDCTPSGLHRMGSLFRVNEAGSKPLWLLDAPNARMLFVPPTAATAATQ
jgi:hypothetical protein